MGSKYKLLPWIHEVVSQVNFSSALDAFSGSGCVGYLLKSMGKRVISNDFLNFSHQIATAAIENSRYRLSTAHCEALLNANAGTNHFIEETFTGIFFAPSDLRFLDRIWRNLDGLPTRFHRALAIAALVRSCVKRQPRGVFTVAGDPENYKDGRRDLRLTLEEHFLESAAAYNEVIFDNGQTHLALRGDIFSVDASGIDLVYMDPPYVPRSDDNCYIKRYHFLEGLASYWRDEGTEILLTTKVRKIAKRFTPFSYRHSALDAFDRMFEKFRHSIIVLSYSSNAYPELDALVSVMKKSKPSVCVFEKEHRYHFGTHDRVATDRAIVREYLIVGQR